jgi:predicted ATP-dependent endonuclease of OLD family
MLIKKVDVKNFRAILDQKLECEQITALVGANGSGKSSFLHALELFYSSTPKITTEDFYAEDTSKEIEITVTFTNLDSEERDQFASYLERDELPVVRVFKLEEGKLSAKYHGSLLQHPPFAGVRHGGGAQEITTKYTEIRDRSEYSDLPRVRAKGAALEELSKWEQAHPDQCQRELDQGQFFGFTEAAQGYLGKYTQFILIPAVRDAAEDTSEGKGSPITQMMDLVVRSILANRSEIQQLREEAQKKYEGLIDPDKILELKQLSVKLTQTLQTYVPKASIILDWIKGSVIDIPMPKANMKVVEDDYPCTVERTGHGLQRGLILTLLQHLALVTASATKPSTPESGERPEEGATTPKTPHFILAIEEPELYQHPNRQRHIARILQELANGNIPGVSKGTQVLYATHSPLFVGLDRFDQVHVFRKLPAGDHKPKVASVISADLDEVAGKLWEAKGRPGDRFTAETLRPRLQTIMTPWMNEGFFADVAVLVEGEGDRSAIIGTALSMGYDFERDGYAVIPCMGKNNLDRPYLVFSQFKIPVYLVWDADADKKNDDAKKQNRYLLRLLGQNEDDWPSGVRDCYAIFESKLEKSLEEEIGPDLFGNLLRKIQADFGFSEKHEAIKNPVVIRRLIEEAKDKDKKCKTLEEIVNKIIVLRSRNS